MAIQIINFQNNPTLHNIPTQNLAIFPSTNQSSHFLLIIQSSYLVRMPPQMLHKPKTTQRI